MPDEIDLNEDEEAALEAAWAALEAEGNFAQATTQGDAPALPVDEEDAGGHKPSAQDGGLRKPGVSGDAP